MLFRSYNSWGCRLTKVIVGNNVYDNDDYALLQGNDRRVKVPSKFFNYLKENTLMHMKKKEYVVIEIFCVLTSMNVFITKLKNFLRLLLYSTTFLYLSKIGNYIGK